MSKELERAHKIYDMLGSESRDGPVVPSYASAVVRLQSVIGTLERFEGFPKISGSNTRDPRLRDEIVEIGECIADATEGSSVFSRIEARKLITELGYLASEVARSGCDKPDRTLGTR